MEMQKLSQEMKKIEMPEEMKKRVIQNCKQGKEKRMMRNEKNMRLKKPLIVTASLTVCFCLLGATALAASGQLKGYFKDIVRWDGAVIGTSYEQATDEINLRVVSVTEELTVLAEITEPDKAPYGFIETMGIESYEIKDSNGKVVIKGDTTEAAKITDGTVIITIPVGQLQSGTYQLSVSGFVGSAKAEQPLVMSGNWVCEFDCATLP